MLTCAVPRVTITTEMLTVGIAFLHTKPDDESRKEALPFKSWKSHETDVGRVKLEIGIFVGFNLVV